jgi:hypothetical protein
VTAALPQIARVGFHAGTTMDTHDSKRKPSQLNKQVIRFGTHKINIYQRGDVIDSSYYFRIHLKEEDRFYRKSLQTTDRVEARQRAQNELIDLLSKLKTGRRVVASSLVLGVANVVVGDCHRVSLRRHFTID